MAADGTCALSLPDGFATGPAEAFIDDHEFCHVHSGGWVHLTLPDAIRESAVRLGWAEKHPSADAGFVPKTWTMVYAPRNEEELEVMLYFIRMSHGFATGAGLEETSAVARGYPERRT